MSNHPAGLDIIDSAGPPPGTLTTSKDASVAITQDITTFGIAGRIWDSSYTLDVFLRAESNLHSFTPSCPIPSQYFLQHTNNNSNPSDSASIANSIVSSPSLPSSSTALPVGSTSTLQKHLRILEIGAGTGYVGIALARRMTPHTTVILTDLEEVTPLLAKNAKDNISPAESCGIVEVEPLAWGNSGHAKAILSKGPIDYLVASDLVYFPELYPPLLETLLEITSLETKVIFGYKERAIWKESPFWEQFGRFFEFEVVRITKKAEVNDKNEDEEQEEETIEIFGCEDLMYVFVATKRQEKDYLVGVDDTLAMIMMMNTGF